MTHEEFVKEMESINPNIRIFGKYTNKTTKLRVECIVDGHVWDALPIRLLNGVGCQKCSNKKNGDTHAITPKEYKNRVFEINPSIEILSEYVNAKTKVSVKCLIDGHIWNAFPSTLYRGGCPKCAYKKISEAKLLSHDEYVKRLRVSNPNIEVLGTYIDARHKIEVRCIKHDFVWKGYPHNFTNGEGCKKCKSEKMSARAMSHDEFVLALSNISPYIEVLGRYENCDNRILVYCKNHDVTWTSIGSRLLSGCGCKKCGIEKVSASNRLSTSEVVDRLKNINPNIVLVGDYYVGNIKSTFKCLLCENEWSAYFSNVMAGTGCPACASSKGESAVKSYIESLGIEYFHQYSFSDCKNTIVLRYDFYIPSLKIAIEYQGEQHYKPIDFAGKGMEWATERFIYGQHTDEIKRKYCRANGIRLVEIKYDEIHRVSEIIDAAILFAQKAVSA